MVTPETLIQIHHDYLKSGQRYPLPHKAFAKSDRLRVSDLATCPAKWAAERAGIQPLNPELAEHSHGKLHMFEQGHRIAEIWQEALHWSPLPFDHEVELFNDVLWGHADGVIHGNIPIEIKNTNYREPQRYHLIQLWGYMWMLGAKKGFLIFQRQDEQQVFQIDGFDKEAVLEAISEKNAAWKDVEKLGMPKRGLESVMPFHCIAEKKDRIYPGQRRQGTITPTCQYFGNCYQLKGSYFITRYSESGDLEIGETAE